MEAWRGVGMEVAEGLAEPGGRVGRKEVAPERTVQRGYVSGGAQAGCVALGQRDRQDPSKRPRPGPSP